MPIDMRDWQVATGLGTARLRTDQDQQQFEQQLALQQAQQALAREAQTFNQGMATDANARANEDQGFQRDLHPSIVSGAQAGALQRWLQLNHEQEMGPYRLANAQIQNQRGQMDLRRGQMEMDQEQAGMAAVGQLADQQGYGATFDPTTGQQTGPASPGALAATSPRTGMDLLGLWHRGADPLRQRQAALQAYDALGEQKINQLIQHFYSGGSQMSPEDMTAAVNQIAAQHQAGRAAIIGGDHLAKILTHAGGMLGQQQITPELIAALKSTDPQIAAHAEALYMNLTGRGVPEHMKGMNPQAVQNLVDKHPTVRSAKRRLDSAQRMLEKAESSDVPDDDLIKARIAQVDEAEQAYEKAQTEVGQKLGRQAQGQQAAKNGEKPAGKAASTAAVDPAEADALRFEAITAFGEEGARKKYPGLFRK